MRHSSQRVVSAHPQPEAELICEHSPGSPPRWGTRSLCPDPGAMVPPTVLSAGEMGSAGAAGHLAQLAPVLSHVRDDFPGTAGTQPRPVARLSARIVMPAHPSTVPAAGRSQRLCNSGENKFSGRQVAQGAQRR